MSSLQSILVRIRVCRLHSSSPQLIMQPIIDKKIESLYTKDQILRYRGTNYFEIEPHIYSLADSAYRSMTSSGKDQVVIISGESGSGKTEASKIFMRYVATVSMSHEKVDHIKDQLLNSNPCLESFGNAKTTRNDNSSRFGKYMDISFDFRGLPVGGRITTCESNVRFAFQWEGPSKHKIPRRPIGKK